MKQLFYLTLLIFVTLNCKNSIATNNPINLESNNSLIVEEKSCNVSFTNDKIYLRYFGDSKVLIIDSLNFITYQLDDIKIHCSIEDLVVNYYENIGNQRVQTLHILNKNKSDVILSKVYKLQSDRNGISVYGLNIQNEFLNYSGMEPDTKTTQIYSFVGFQEELEPSITPYYNRMTSLFAKQDISQLIFIGDTIVWYYLIDNIGIKNSNVAKYNDIAYYLEQSGAYTEAIFLLEEIIKEFPNRMVAYVNLGDAYWGLKDVQKAKKSYGEYIKQMKNKGNESKIPKRLLKRFN